MKKSLADRIEQYLKVLIDRSDEKQIEIQRAELAETFSCVPSQVTYVLNTRFTEDEGYVTESRRGGKGYVRITQFRFDSDLNILPNRVELLKFIDHLHSDNIIGSSEHEMLRHLVIYAFRDITLEQRNRLFKSLKYALSDYFKVD
ncbi:CtsR family transcriptional regulator [Syntrophomonas palmitatica]|uniref:CtsR family transcriptional regulator n=1 Tax=Syntrophomonas palmitatica TaxID=402877 RepID=UPI0006D236CB|nr:CtsR family transcriptional regulator [Syntrophomonas palmitatica]